MYKKISFISVLLGALMLFGGSAAAQDQGYVIEERGSRTFSSWFEKRFHTSAEQWEYAHGLQNRKKLKKADKAMLYLVRRWPNSLEAPLAQRARADMLLARKKYKKAFKEYQALVDNYSGRMRDYDGVLANQFDIAVHEMNRKRIRWIFGGFKAPENAVPYFEDIVRNGPAWERAPEAQFMIGKAYQSANDYELAVSAFSVLEFRYSKSDYAEKALWEKIHTLRDMQKTSPNDEALLDRTLTSTTVFLGTFPQSEHRDEIILLRNSIYEEKAQRAFDLAEFYVKVARRPRAAVKYFEVMIAEFPKSKLVPEAEARLAELQQFVAFDDVRKGKRAPDAAPEGESAAPAKETGNA